MENRDINSYTQVYLHDDFEKIQVHYRREVVLKTLQKYHPRHILEIGCGAESIALYYKDYDDLLVVEPSQPFVNINKSKNLYNTSFITGSFGEVIVTNQICEYIKEKGAFDFILCSSLIHELSDFSPILSTIRTLATDETIIHINVPNSNSFHKIWALRAGLIPSLDSLSQTAINYQQHHTFDAELLSKTADDYGFEVIESGGIGFKLFNNAKMLKLLEMGILDDKLLDALESMSDLFPGNTAEIFVNCKRKKN